MATRSEAEEAMYAAIASAARWAEEKRDGTLLETASRAFCNVAYGDHGGRYDMTRQDIYKGETDYRYTSHNRQETDYHETQHQGEDRERPPAGFAVEDQLPPMGWEGGES